MRNKKHGFTLVEIAIVIAILGIIIAGLFAGMGSIRESAKFKQDQRMLNDIKKAIITYTSVNGYLPCPDVDIPKNGRENRDSTTLLCVNTSGELPYLDLETHRLNAYNLPFTYIINQIAIDSDEAYSSTSSGSYFAAGNCIDVFTVNNIDAPCFHFNTPPMPNHNATDNLGNYRIVNDITESRIFAAQVPAVVISHGQNGCPGESIFEQHNCLPNGNDSVFYQAQQNRDNFDDVLIWVSAQEIKGAANASQANVPRTRRVTYNFDEMTETEIEEFLDLDQLRFIDGRAGQAGWEANTDPGILDQEGNSVDSVLRSIPGSEQLMLIPIPEDYEQYRVSVIARLSPGTTGGYGIFFDTNLEDDDDALRDNSRIQKGYAYQFNRGSIDRLLVRPWNLLDSTTSTNSEGAADFHYPREPVPMVGTSAYDAYLLERGRVPDRTTDADWWTEIYRTDIIVTGSGTDRNATIRILGWNSESQDWTRLIAQIEYPKPYAYSFLTPTVTDQGETIEHLIFDETKQLYTGLRTWSTEPTDFYAFEIMQIID